MKQKPISTLFLVIVTIAFLAVFAAGYGFGVYTNQLAINERLRSEGLR